MLLSYDQMGRKFKILTAFLQSELGASNEAVKLPFCSSLPVANGKSFKIGDWVGILARIFQGHPTRISFKTT